MPGDPTMDMAAMVGDVIPELVLLVGGVVILLYALFAPSRVQAGAGLVAAVVVAAALVATVPMLADLGAPERLTFFDTYARDGVAAWGKVVILVATAGVIGLSAAWFRTDPRQGEYYTLVVFSALGAILLAGATDLKEFVVAMILSSATGFILTAYHRASGMASEAAMKYYLIGAFSSAAMLIGVAYLFGLAGSTLLGELEATLGDAGVAGVALGGGLVLLALLFKIGAVPAHAWMPDVAQGAPGPVAAFVTTVPKVGGFIFLARLVLAAQGSGLDWAFVVSIAATATMTLGNLACLWQTDVRRLLGWSAVSQTGYGLLAVVAIGSSDLAVPALLFFLLAYALGNVAAFGVVVELRGRTSLADYAGLGRAHPWLIGALLMAFLSFIGVPPLAGFVAKLLLFGVAIEVGYGWLAIVAAVNTVISIVYYVRVLAPAYFDDARQPAPVLGQWAAVATAATAAAVVVVGVAAEPFVRAFELAGILR